MESKAREQKIRGIIEECIKKHERNQACDIKGFQPSWDLSLLIFNALEAAISKGEVEGVGVCEGCKIVEALDQAGAYLEEGKEQG